MITHVLFCTLQSGMWSKGFASWEEAEKFGYDWFLKTQSVDLGTPTLEEFWEEEVHKVLRATEWFLIVKLGEPIDPVRKAEPALGCEDR